MDKEIYLKLSRKISIIIKELNELQSSLDDDYYKTNNTSSNTMSKNKKKPSLNAVIDEFSSAVVNDDIDIGTITKLEGILKCKKDDLVQ